MEIQTAAAYQAALVEIKELITTTPEATAAIAALAEAIDDYEIKAGHSPVRPDTLVGRLEIEMFNRQLNRKQMADLLGIPASRFSDLLNGKTSVNMTLAKKLYKLLAIPADFILEAA
jgi:antitoxin component HigA of HigAB toxin-antitoxin module